MARSKKKTACCKPDVGESGGYHVESIITVDERGQMVLPKSIREKARIAAGVAALTQWSAGLTWEAVPEPVRRRAALVLPGRGSYTERSPGQLALDQGR